jgi:hypothetical protein
LGLIFGIVGFFVYYKSNNIWGFICAEVIAALSSALKSGTLLSWMRNAFGREVQIKARTSYKVVSSISMIIGALVSGAVTSQLGLEVGWLMASLALMILVCTAALILQFLPSGRNYEGVGGGGDVSLDLSIVSVFKHVTSHPTLLTIIIALALLQFSAMPVNMYWALIAREQGLAA